MKIQTIQQNKLEEFKVNIIIATVNIPFLLFNLAGVAWIHMVIGAVVQVILSGLIIYYAWKWPRVET